MKRFLKHLPKVALLVMALLPFALLRDERVRGALVAGMDYLQGAGARGWLVFLLMEVVGGLLVVPIWLLSAMAGYIYGFPQGVPLAVMGVTLAGSSAFVVGRLLGSRWMESSSFVQGTYWRAVRWATLREGLKIALLLRVTPVMPQNLLHYLLSSTSLTLRHFALGTGLGLLPVTMLQVYAGSLVKSATALVAGETSVGGPLRWVVPALAVGATLVAGFFLARVGRRMLRETLAGSGEAGASDNLSQDPPSA